MGAKTGGLIVALALQPDEAAEEGGLDQAENESDLVGEDQSIFSRVGSGVLCAGKFPF